MKYILIILLMISNFATAFAYDPYDPQGGSYAQATSQERSVGSGNSFGWPDRDQINRNEAYPGWTPQERAQHVTLGGD